MTDPKKMPKPDAKVTTTADGKPTMAVQSRAFAKIGGTDNFDFNITLLREALSCVWVPGDEEDGQARRAKATMVALKAFEPKDAIEGMLAAQAVAMHFGAMEAFRRSMLPEQPSDVISKLRKDGANLSRGMTDMLEALDRKRGKGLQVVRVERVVVHEGGQAVVGNVQAGARPSSGATDNTGAHRGAPAEAAAAQPAALDAPAFVQTLNMSAIPAERDRAILDNVPAHDGGRG